jgi:hypothetical protein
MKGNKENKMTIKEILASINKVKFIYLHLDISRDKYSQDYFRISKVEARHRLSHMMNDIEINAEVKCGDTLLIKAVGK